MCITIITMESGVNMLAQPGSFSIYLLCSLRYTSLCLEPIIAEWETRHIIMLLARASIYYNIRVYACNAFCIAWTQQLIVFVNFEATCYADNIAMIRDTDVTFEFEYR